MRTILFIFISCFMLGALHAQTSDKVFKLGRLKVYKNQENGFYQIKKGRKVMIDSLLHVNKLGSDLMELVGNDLEVYHLNKKGEGVAYQHPSERKRQVDNFCGTDLLTEQSRYPKIELIRDSILVYAGASKNVPSASYSIRIGQLRKIRGELKYRTYQAESIPRIEKGKAFMVFRKDGKEGLLGVDQIADKDRIWFQEGCLFFKQNGLLGFYGISEKARYKKLDAFKNGYARFELENGQKGLLSISGKEILAIN
jgi:hypothetical protein